MAKEVSFHKGLRERLKNPELSLRLLNRFNIDEDYRIFMGVLQEVLLAEYSMTQIAKLSGLSRTTLYKIFSGETDIQNSTLNKLLDLRGFKVKFALNKADKSKIKGIVKVADIPEVSKNIAR